MHSQKVNGIRTGRHSHTRTNTDKHYLQNGLLRARWRSKHYCALFHAFHIILWHGSEKDAHMSHYSKYKSCPVTYACCTVMHSNCTVTLLHSEKWAHITWLLCNELSSLPDIWHDFFSLYMLTKWRRCMCGSGVLLEQQRLHDDRL